MGYGYNNTCLENWLWWSFRRKFSDELPNEESADSQPSSSNGYCSVQILSIRDLAFRGSEEVFGSPHNGNFMGALELLAEFDPFIRKHIEQRELRPKSIISYLSKTVYEEIIEFMGQQIIKQIITQINNDDTKYYSIVVDSTPDLSHNDQLAIVLRHYFRGKVYERCVSFIKICSHTGLHLFNILQDVLETNGLLLDNCRGQSYDNAANMAGNYNGVQALLKQRNKSADCVPCAAHSLKLVKNLLRLQPKL
ncbi:zinc finger MYM-type protein 1-like [Parasteatoda tepidariorum]|uniref:zinc finger MYM-type protein 1-like n=1 Tax=Parasteatoda tepidariorum TaxID=114398 RepID=UPI0039BC5D08